MSEQGIVARRDGCQRSSSRPRHNRQTCLETNLLLLTPVLKRITNQVTSCSLSCKQSQVKTCGVSLTLRRAAQPDYSAPHTSRLHASKTFDMNIGQPLRFDANRSRCSKVCVESIGSHGVSVFRGGKRHQAANSAGRCDTQQSCDAAGDRRTTDVTC